MRSCVAGIVSRTSTTSGSAVITASTFRPIRCPRPVYCSENANQAGGSTQTPTYFTSPQKLLVARSFVLVDSSMA
jgi:hypothetical protein